MNRQQKRQQERNHEKIKNRTYTFEDCRKIVSATVKDTERKYDALYSSCLAASLSAPPYNFGRKRVCAFLQLFFGQLEAVNLGTVTDEQLKAVSERLGVYITSDDDTLSVTLDVDPKPPTYEKKK